MADTSLFPELRGRLYNQSLLRALHYSGPGVLTLAGAATSVPIVVEQLSVAPRPELALAVIAGAPGSAGAAVLAGVLSRHAEVIESGLLDPGKATDAVLGLPVPRPGADLIASAMGLRDAKALIGLGVAIEIDGWSAELSDAAQCSTDLRELLAIGQSGHRPALVRLAELLRGPGPAPLAELLTRAGVRAEADGWVDPSLTWRLVTALRPIDPLLARAVSDAFVDAVSRAVARGVFAPAFLTADGDPVGAAEDPATAAALLLLTTELAGPPLESTPPVRGTVLDEGLYLLGARELDPDAEVAPGLTAGALLAEHVRPELAPGVSYQAGVVYGVSDGQPQRLHLFTPAPEEGRSAPVAVFIHGGGWVSGNPAKFLRQCADWAAQGWIAASIGYRLVPETVWPGPLQDVQAALQFVADQAAELGADPKRVVLIGNSAGGQLALIAGSLPSAVTVRGVVAISPLTDMLWPAIIPDGGRLVRRLVGNDETLLPHASCVTHVHSEMPPVLTITGGIDELTTPDMIGAYHQRLDEAGVPNELVVLPGRFHAFEFALEDARFWSERALGFAQDQCQARSVPA